MSNVQFVPNDFIVIPKINEKCESSFKIVNNSDKNLAQKIKTTNPKCQVVKPNNGILEAHSEQFIKVTTQLSITHQPTVSDKFLIQYLLTDYEPTLNPGVMNAYWNYHTSFETRKFEVKFLDSSDKPNLKNIQAFHSAKSSESKLTKALKDNTDLKEEIAYLRKKGQGQIYFSYFWSIMILLLVLSLCFRWGIFMEKNDNAQAVSTKYMADTYKDTTLFFNDSYKTTSKFLGDSWNATSNFVGGTWTQFWSSLWQFKNWVKKGIMWVIDTII